jgi:hypothetical protein
MPTHTLTNPAGTVTVTVLLDGRVTGVELGTGALAMTEMELSEEIRVIADLARQQVRSELNAFLSESMGASGHDAAFFRDSLERDMDMPTRENAAAATARAFAERYAADEDFDDDEDE